MGSCLFAGLIGRHSFLVLLQHVFRTIYEFFESVALSEIESVLLLLDGRAHLTVSILRFDVVALVVNKVDFVAEEGGVEHEERHAAV